MPTADFGALSDALHQACVAAGLQPVTGFLHKCMQLYETILVRHGLMEVGQTFSGKTAVDFRQKGVDSRAPDSCFPS